jgi:hypothetical protein
MRRLLAISLGVVTAPLHAQAVKVAPLFGTELRYEQYASDRLLSADDAVLFQARPGVALTSGPWSLDVVSDAAVALRRSETALAAGRPTRPEAARLGEFRLDYKGLPKTDISLGRQRLGIAGANLTGDRDGQQTFDAARLKWSGVAGLSADVAYAWSSSSLYTTADRPLPESVRGDNLFAQLNWKSRVGTLSGYAYQIDQRATADSQFRLLNQVYGARFSGSRPIGQNTKLNYSMGYVRQTGALANPAAGTPTYWQIGNSFNLGDLSATQTSYKRFAANGISTLNGDTLSFATSATRGRMTLGASYSDFRPIAASGAAANQNLKVSLGMAF